VLLLVLTEALVLCLFAAAMGLLISSFVFSSPPMKEMFGDSHMPAIVIAMGAVMALLLSLVSGLPPAWRARQLNIVDALAGR